MANQDDGFLRQIEEELRRERIEKIWREYGTYLLLAAALIVVGVLAFQYLQSQRTAAAQAMGARYEGALELASEGKEGSAAKEFEIIAQEGTGGYAALARLQLAGALIKEGKKEEALAAFEALANDGDADKMLRDYAALQAASLRLGTADFTEMENRLTPLIGDDSPWRYSARELLGLAAFQSGKPGSEVRLILTPLLVDQKTPQTITNRVQIVMAQIAAAEMAKKAEASPPTSGSASEETKAEGAPAEGTPTATKKE